MKLKGFIAFLLLGLTMIYAKSSIQNSIYVDQSLSTLHLNGGVSSQSFHIFSHGKPGYLFIDNQWLSAPEIAVKFKKEFVGKKELYIYGCNFARGEKGLEAIAYLEKNLHLKVNASTNITGKNGDWILEIGNGKNGLKLPNFDRDLQLDKTHYLNPLICGAYSSGTITDEYIYLSTSYVNATPSDPTKDFINVQMNFASGIGSPRISITNLTTNAITYSTTGLVTINNSNPVRIQFVTAGNVIIPPGTTPTTIPLNKGGTTIPGDTYGLKFSSSDNFFVNYRARSGSQAGSMLTKGSVALGSEFRWGGSPVEFPDAGVPETGNMLSIMATVDNTTVTISNIKTGTKFVNGALGTTLTGSASGTITKILNKGDSFILYAPIAAASSIQDTGWLGAKVVSTNPVAVAVGGLMQQGAAAANRDIGFDQLVPVSKLGLDHIIMAGNGGVNEKVIVVATADNTKVFVNGSTTAFATLLNAGDYTLINNLASAPNFNSDKNMFVKVSSPAYVFQKIYGGSAGNTNSLMFIPPLSCFGQNSVDLIPDASKIGTTSYTATQVVVLAGTGSGNVPVVTENGSATPLTPFASGGVVTGNTNWLSYRYNLTQPNSNVKISSAGTILAEVFGASGAAGFGGYYSGFGSTAAYTVTASTKYGFLCPGTDSVSVPEGLGTYQWYRNDAVIPGATSSTYTLNSAGDSLPATYYAIITVSGGCTITSNQVTSDTCPCTKPSNTAIPNEFTKLGISIRDKRSTANWPLDIANGFLTMEANNKGFVITRLAFPETNIPNPVIGMLIYDTNKNCLAMYDGTSWKCIKQTCN